MQRTIITLLVVSLVTFSAFSAHFQDSNGIIIIRSETAEFRCESAEFPDYEPTYEAPPDGAIRIWTDAYQALQQDGNQTGDPFYTPERFADYVGNIAAYQAAWNAANITPTPTPTPTIYANVTLSKDTLRVDTADSLIFAATLEDGQGQVLDVTETWIIRLRNASGEEVDAFEASFVNGSTGDMIYTPVDGMLPGRIFLLASDFEPVVVPGIGTFQVGLINPVQITLYRQL